MRHEEVIEKVDVLDLISKLGIEGEIQGKEFVGHCPFPEHDDKTPSFSISILGDRRGMWQCFGCDSKGNTIHLVQRVLGIEKEQAEKQIAQWFNFPDSLNFPSTQEITRLLDRGQIRSEEEEEMVRIPLPRIVSDKTRIIDYLVKKRNYIEAKAWDIINFFNMSWADSGYYHDRIIIPVYDSIGSLITFEARDLTRQADKKALYPKGSPISKLLFNNHNINEKYVWVTEGIWDAIRLWSFGEPAISCFGAHLSNYQAQILISKYSDVFLLYDGDEAGRKAKEKASEILKPYINVYEVDLMFGDPADLTKEEFRELMRQLNIKR